MIYPSATVWLNHWHKLTSKIAIVQQLRYCLSKIYNANEFNVINHTMYITCWNLGVKNRKKGHIIREMISKLWNVSAKQRHPTTKLTASKRLKTNRAYNTFSNGHNNLIWLLYSEQLIQNLSLISHSLLFSFINLFVKL